MLDLADALLAAGSVLNAEKLYARYVRSSLAAHAHLGLARCASLRGQHPEAIWHLRNAQSLAPDHPGLGAAAHDIVAAIAN